MDSLGFISSLSGVIELASHIAQYKSYEAKDAQIFYIMNDAQVLKGLLQEVTEIVLNAKYRPRESVIGALESCKNSAAKFGDIIRYHETEGKWQQRFKQVISKKKIY